VEPQLAGSTGKAKPALKGGASKVLPGSRKSGANLGSNMGPSVRLPMRAILKAAVNRSLND
jgi:hypothetical protein